MSDYGFEHWWRIYSAGTGSDIERAIALRAWQAGRHELLREQQESKERTCLYPMDTTQR